MTTSPPPRVALRLATDHDAARLQEIRSTPEVRRWWDDVDETDTATAVQAGEGDDDDATRLVIEFDGVVVGSIQYAEEDDPQYRHASIDIYVDPAVHRRGVGSAAIRMVLGELFDRRGHHRVTIDPSVDNTAAIECYRRIGFREVGVMRRYERRRDGTWGDGLLMELLDTDPVDDAGRAATPNG